MDYLDNPWDNRAEHNYELVRIYEEELKRKLSPKRFVEALDKYLFYRTRMEGYTHEEASKMYPFVP